MKSLLRMLWVLLFFCMAARIQAAAPNGMLAWYPLDGNFQDFSGNGRHLTATAGSNFFASGGVGADKKICYAPVLSPGTECGVTGPVLPLNAARGFTISGFVAMPKDNNYYAIFFGCGKADYRSSGALLYAPYGVIHTKIGSGNGVRHVRLNDGQWHHYALAVATDAAGKAGYDVYIDGKKAYHAPMEALSDYGNFVLGFFDGPQTAGLKIDEVKVFGRTLSAAEIKTEAERLGASAEPVVPQSVTPAAAVRRADDTCRRSVPVKYDFPLQGRLKVYFLTSDWLCVAGDYNDFIRERLKTECGRFLKKLDTGGISIRPWSYDFHYDFAAIEVLSDYQPRIKNNFENPDYFKITTDNGQPVKIVKNSYWLNAVGQMRVPVIATGEEKIVNCAETAHFAYLNLAPPLKNGEKYTITTNAGEKISFVYDEKKNISRAIKVNQVGYLPDAGMKYAYLGGWLAAAGPLPLSDFQDKKFYLIDEKNGAEVFCGTIVLRMNEQYYTGTPGKKIPLNGETVCEMDFSAFTKPGRYHLYVPGIGRSWSFLIGPDAIGRAFYVHARGLFHQRSGIAKGKPYTNWPMAADHTKSWEGGFSPEDADYNVLTKDGSGYTYADGRPLSVDHFTVVRETVTERALPNVWGGWWDAADFDRRIHHFRIVEDLLTAYFMFPENFSDGQLDIPESGNGIPDIIDEAAWGVDVWRRAQNQQGGVGCWLEADSHPKIYHPAKDTQRYYLALPTRAATIQYAAYAAMLARALKQAGAIGKADTFFHSAEKAFDYAMNPANRAEKNWRHYDDKAGEYEECRFQEPLRLNDVDIFKAALNLYLYRTDRKFKHWLTKDVFEKALRETEYPRTPYFLMEVFLAKEEFPAFAGTYREEILKRARQWRQNQEMLAYRNLAFPPYHPFFRNLAWGNAIPFNKGRYFIAAYRITGRIEYRDAALLLNDWMCGANQLGRTMTTGLGTVSPVRVLSLASYADGIPEPLPGLTLYTFTSEIDGNSRKMVYALDFQPREDHDFKGVSQCLLPAALSGGNNMNYEKISSVLEPFYPVWRRFAALEALSVPQSEFTVWETIGPCASALGCLLPPGWKPPREWKNLQPWNDITKTEGYLFLP